MPPTAVRFRPGLVVPRSVYLDTNLFLHARDRDSVKYQAASHCLTELIRQDAELYTSTLVFDELWWALLRTSYRIATGRTLTASIYKRDPEIWRQSWPRIRQITAEIIAWPRLHILDLRSGPTIVENAASLIDMSPLAPRDAFHLAIALSHDILSLVTADPDYDLVALPRDARLTVIRF